MTQTRTQSPTASPPLEGLVVIDLTRYIAGPYCTMLMADAGATVVKVEPMRGEDTRHLAPFIEDPSGEPVSAYFLRMNRNKRSIGLDLKSPEGLGALEKLLLHADVLVENFRPGVLARLGLSEEKLQALNPRLVYCSISGFGHSPSPLRERAAYNVVAEYEAGVYVKRATDGLPGPVGPPVGDMFPALHALSGVMMALYRRNITGRGERVDIAMYDSMLSLNELRSSYARLYGQQWDPYEHPFYCPYGVYEVADGYLCIDVTTDRQWRNFCVATGRPELYDVEGLTTGPSRVAKYEELIREPLEEWLGAHTRDDAVAIFSAHGVPTAAVRSPGEALESEQARARAMDLEIRDVSGARVNTAGNPIKIGAWNDAVEAEAPGLAADTEWVLRELAGMTEESVAELFELKVARKGC